ncbi:phospholipid carrier-dependent glycosyltransferase [Bizionia sediminis]|uniref:Phospholipid carrier-dependent glycosyltransferase n=1 Tax=Bizionia sediminis TaxID=1737064 RepID=A0ABW5KNW0_9FLAO
MIGRFNILKIETVLILMGIGLLLLYFVIYPVVSFDSGYYMSTMREMHQGNIYFKDIASPYNPLAISILSIPFFFSDFPDFRWSLFLNISFIIGSGFILYHILSHFKIPRILQTFLALFFIILCFTHDGNHIMLEPISVFFQLCALYLYIQHRAGSSFNKLFFIGIFLGLSFLTKQYALFLLAPIGIDILLRRKDILKHIAIIGVGLIFPIFILFIYYYFNDMPVGVFIKNILGKGVNLDIGTGTGIGSPFKLSYLISFLLANAFVVMIPFLIKRSQSNTPDLVFYTLLAASSFSVFLFAAYSHYFQYTFPYVLIVFAYAASSVPDITKNRIFQILCLIALIKIGLLTASTVKHQRRNFKQQAHTLQVIKTHIPSGSRVYLSGPSPAYYYLGNFKSIQLDRIGFSFPGYFYPESIISAMEKNDYLAISEAYIQSFESFKSDFIRKKITLKDTHFYLYQKK